MATPDTKGVKLALYQGLLTFVTKEMDTEIAPLKILRFPTVGMLSGSVFCNIMLIFCPRLGIFIYFSKVSTVK
jgi:hypothetical protein